MTAVSERLDAIEARKNAATPGPWTRNDYVDVDYDGAFDLAHVTAPDLDEPDTAVQGIALGILRNDAEFIAHAPEDVAYLLDLARKQQAALDAVKALHREEPKQAGDLLGPYCAVCVSPIDGGPELWPCLTIKALEATP